MLRFPPTPFEILHSIYYLRAKRFILLPRIKRTSELVIAGDHCYDRVKRFIDSYSDCDTREEKIKRQAE